MLTSCTKSWNFLSYLWAVDGSSSLLVVLEWPGCCSLLFCWFPLSRFRNSIFFLNCAILFASLACCCWFVWFFSGGCLRHFLYQIGQQFAFHCPRRRTKCNGCSPIKVKENFTTPSSFQQFQNWPNIVFLQLTFENTIIRNTVGYHYITWYSITLNN